MALDGDAALFFEIHIIEHLTLGHLDGIGELKQTVGKGRLTMVDVCNDAEVSDMFHSTIYFF